MATSSCDETCVGIKSIVFNSDDTMTVTLTNGRSYTSPVLKGAKGDKGDTGAPGVVLVYNNYAGVSTTGLGAYEVLDTAPLTAIVTTNKDLVKITANFSCGSALTPNLTITQKCRVRIGSQTLVETAFDNTQYNVKTIEVYITRLSNTTAKATYVVTTLQNIIITNILVANGIASDIINITGLDFTTLQNITAEGYSAMGETVEVTSQSLEVEYLPIT